MNLYLLFWFSIFGEKLSDNVLLCQPEASFRLEETSFRVEMDI